MPELPKSQQAHLDLAEIEEIVRQKIRDGETVEVRYTDEQKAVLAELCQLYRNDPIGFAARVKEVRPIFGDVASRFIEQQVRKVADKIDPPQVNLDSDDDVVEELVRIAIREADLWHNEYKTPYATIERDGHVENLEVGKEDFQYFIADKFGEKYQREIDGELKPMYPPQRCVRSALFHISNHARHGDERDPKIRIAAYRDELWIDLGNREWSAIVVNADGWRIASRIEAPLIRGAGVRPLPIPENDGDIRELSKFVNLKDDGALVLFCGTMATILNPFGNFLTQILCGPAGSGKSTATRVMRALTDPNKNDTRRFVSVRDLMHGAANTHVIALENVSKIQDDLSDTICALNTGTGCSERKYYAQGIEWSIRTRNPIIINGIPANLAARSDLLDRTVTFVFDYLGESVRSDDVFWWNFNSASGKLFGALLNGLVGAMKVRAEFGGDIDKAAEAILGGYRPRFVDAIVWAEATCRTMGFNPGEFSDAFRVNQDVAMRYIAEHNEICVGIRKLMAGREDEWRGYPAQLSAAIRPYVLIGPSAETIGKQLPWVIPVLEKVDGIPVVMNKRLSQNDNRNGIIIGVGRGRLHKAQLIRRSAWRGV